MSLCSAVPNPPGPLDILAKTNNSIDVKWQEAPLMTVGSFHYRLSISPPGGGVNVSLTNTSHSFAPLLSGTPYNISVLTVGALGFESEEVKIYMVNTSKRFVHMLGIKKKKQFRYIVDLDLHQPSFPHNQNLSTWKIWECIHWERMIPRWCGIIPTTTRKATISMWPGKALRASQATGLWKIRLTSLTWFLAVCITSSSPQRPSMEPRLIPSGFPAAQVWSWSRDHWSFWLSDHPVECFVWQQMPARCLIYSVKVPTQKTPLSSCPGSVPAASILLSRSF